MVKQSNRLFDFVKLHFGYNPWDQTSTDFFVLQINKTFIFISEVNLLITLGARVQAD